MNFFGMIVASRFGTVYISTRHNKARSSVRELHNVLLFLFSRTTIETFGLCLKNS